MKHKKNPISSLELKESKLCLGRKVARGKKVKMGCKNRRRNM